MGAIAIRNETQDALQVLVNKGNDSQGDVVVSLSDVIDALLELAASTPTEKEEAVEAIVAVAKQN